MPTLPSQLEVCRVDLFTDEAELRGKYPVHIVERLLRIRKMYNYWLSNPSMKDRQLRDTITSRFGISQSQAYSDIQIIHSLVPLIAQKSREFHRARTNEMLLETYAMAKARKDTKTMERVAATYSKTNQLDKEEEQPISFDDIAVPSITPTLDPTVLGIKPIPNYDKFVTKLLRDLSGSYADVMDVEAEEPDLEEKFLFAPLPDDTGKS